MTNPVKTQPGSLMKLFRQVPRIAADLSANLPIEALSVFRERNRLDRLLPQDAAAGGPEEQKLIKLERGNGRNDLLPFSMLEQGTLAGRPVCKIERQDGRPGTGFLVSPNVILTNNHVISSFEEAERSVCIFNYELDIEGNSRSPVSVRLDPAGLFITSDTVEFEGLDYTFVKIATGRDTVFGHVRASRGSSNISKGEPANLIHHPEGSPKCVTIQDNRVDEDQGLLLKYLSDTEGGSSGAPVFNNRWQGVGLHFGAEPAPAGTLDMRGHPADYLNLAVKLSAVAADLERRIQITADSRQAIAALSLFEHTDTLLGGYFGALGRQSDRNESPINQVHKLYTSAQDLDIGFLRSGNEISENASLLSQYAKFVSELALDVYVLADCPRHVAQRLVRMLRDQYGMSYELEPARQENQAQTYFAIWNTRTVKLDGSGWHAGSRQPFGDAAAPRDAHGDPGPLFEQSPERYRFVRLRGQDKSWPPVDVVPVWLTDGDISDGRRQRVMDELHVAYGEATSENPAPVLVIGGRFDPMRPIPEFLGDQQVTAQATHRPTGATVAIMTQRGSSVKRVWTPPDLAGSAGSGLLAPAPARPSFPSPGKGIVLPPLILRLSFGD
ncbi:trypsin-like serine peptidase [Methylobacterium tarhaniae]|uniref:trypsin-like serine peptidase n=1 Tax=Methylobacterium tarhaniae TaxID=1187852 RepID=UPI000AECAB65|nr:serine protease [Methylobacterium tarhaniae]